MNPSHTTLFEDPLFKVGLFAETPAPEGDPPPNIDQPGDGDPPPNLAPPPDEEPPIDPDGGPVG